MPIMDILERNTVKDIQKIEDTTFMAAVEEAIINSANSGTWGNRSAYSGTLDPSVFVKLFDILEDAGGSATANPLQCDTILMNQQDFNKLLLWQAQYAGDDFATTVTIEGFKFPTIMGRKVITSIKGNLVPPGTVYGFASPEFLGKFYLLGDMRFYIDKVRNIIKWSALETVGMAIGNTQSVAKITYTEFGG